MIVTPHLTQKDWHEYAGSSIDVPAPVGYIDATACYNATMKEILSADLSFPELKRTLLEFIIERQEFTTHAQKYMDSQEYKSHPIYISEQQEKRRCHCQ